MSRSSQSLPATRMLNNLQVIKSIWLTQSLTILLCFSMAFLPATRAARNGNKTSESARAERLAVFDDVWETVRARYYDSELGGLDWDGLRKSYRKLAAEAGSSAELYQVLRQMLGLLNDPHTRISSPEEKFDWRKPRFVSIGLRVREVEGVPTVVEVEAGSAPAKSGVRPGDVIQSIDDEPALESINRRFLGTASSISASQRRQAVSLVLDGPPDTYLTLRWQSTTGGEESGRFRREWRQHEPQISFRRERGKYLVVRLDAFTRKITANYAREFNVRARTARGIVLDLRSNGGGETDAMIEIASSFLRAGTKLGRFVDRSGTTIELTTQSGSRVTAYRITSNSLPMVVLTSERTSSAAEILSDALRASQRATIIGSRTCGCVLAIRNRHTLPDGGVLEISEFDYRTARDSRLEGRGIAPDLEVLVTQSDLRSGRDRALEAALKKLAHAMIPNRK